ncbi:iron ABC transporter permease [Citricoccus sp. SGAir0253]|uniref:ABC transporter permease n=1 Tax=Citricoccus sp. SGAir0253 TaxID=2567881 RepID=UPI0010CCDFCB|nr:iron ABC transporter permease [Citricoccus sp. SGAir0253]QCU77011.1 iron ABC transporter permease [Citricoccus sp. SGAir0253]
MTSTPVRRMLRSPFVLITVAVLTWFIVAFLVWPNANLLVETFFPDGQYSNRAVEKLLSSERAMRSLANSFLLAVALSVTTNVVGVFIVLVTQYFRIRGARILWCGYATTFIYGGIVLAAGYKFIYGEDGIVTGLLLWLVPGLDPGWFTGFWAVLFTMTFATTTNHMLFLSSSLVAVDHQTIEAARNMGAGNWTILRRIVLPMLRPMLFAVTILSFLTGLGALSAPQVLGGREFQTIAPMILTFAGSPTSRDLAALLAIVLGVATIVMLVVMSRVERGGTYFSLSKVSTRIQKQPIIHRGANLTVHVIAYALFGVYVLPVVLIVLYSFVDSTTIQTAGLSLDKMTLDNYVRVLGEGSSLRPFVVSVAYSAAAAAIAVGGLLFVARILSKYRNWLTAALEYLLHIPWILPAAMIALGLIMSYDHPSALVGNVVLTGTTVILLIAFVIVKIPFTLRLLKAAFSSVNSTLEEAATLMGARSLYTFRRILLPAVLPPAAAVFALNFNSLLDDYDTAVFLAHPLFQPLGLVIKANTEGSVSLDARANTFVYAVLLMVITGLTMYLVYGRAARRRPRRSAASGPPSGLPSGALDGGAPAASTTGTVGGVPAATAPVGDAGAHGTVVR